MIIPDVNLLLYATINAFAEHRAARTWWEDALNSTTEIGLASPVIFGYIRIATNPRIFTPPLSVDAATGYVADWLRQANVVHLVPGTRHLDIAFDLLRSSGTGANLTTGAQLGALAIEFDADMCSNDSDFARFPAVRWTNPLADHRHTGMRDG